MSIPNGVRSPSTPSETTNIAHTIGKRKRPEDSEDVNDFEMTSKKNDAEKTKGSLSELMKDLLEVLKRYAPVALYLTRCTSEVWYSRVSIHADAMCLDKIPHPQS